MLARYEHAAGIMLIVVSVLGPSSVPAMCLLELRPLKVSLPPRLSHIIVKLEVGGYSEVVSKTWLRLCISPANFHVRRFILSSPLDVRTIKALNAFPLTLDT